MYYEPEVVEEVRIGNDIVSFISSYVVLKQSGNSYFGLCPFHNESTPSFSVSADKQLYHCFGCGASGNVISFAMAIENLDFTSAVKFLAERINFKLPEGKLDTDAKERIRLKELVLEMHILAARFFYENLNSTKGGIAKNYLENRKISLNIQRRFGLGYADKSKDSLYKYLLKSGYDSDTILKSGLAIAGKKNKGEYYDRFYNRLMFPILDVGGKIIGFGGRVLDDGQHRKYLNSPDTVIFDKSKNLYGLNFARKSNLKEMVLVEGYMDTISMHQSGILNAIASLGTSFNISHARLLRKYADSAVILFDSDEAGIKAALRAIPILLESGLKVKVLLLENAKDPDEFLQKFGASNLKKSIEKADNHIGFQVNLLKNKYDLSNTEDKIEFTYEISKILSSLKDNVLIDAYSDEVSKMTNISKDSIISHINKISDTPVKELNSNIKKQKRYNNKNIKEKGLADSNKGLLYIISENYDIYLKVKDIIRPEEFSEDIFRRLASVIYERHEKKHNIYPAEIVNFFETQEEQEQVSEIFITQIEYKDLEKAVNQQIKHIKKINLDLEISEKLLQGDNDALKILLLEEKKLNKLYITLIDG